MIPLITSGLVNLLYPAVQQTLYGFSGRTVMVYSMVENCWISSAGMCCSVMEAYWGGN